MTAHTPSSKFTPGTQRIEALTDAVYAIAMTILVLNIETPPRPIESSAVLWQQLLRRWPKFLHYALGFVILASFWAAHHVQFHRIKRADRTLLWTNLACLMFVGLLPFSTCLMAEYGDFQVAAIVFHGNMFLTGLLFYINWIYAAGRGRLVEESVDGATVASTSRENLIVPALALLGLGISFLTPRWSMVLYLVIPFVMVGKSKARETTKEKQ